MDSTIFNSKRYLYHYTKFDSAIKILSNMTLLFHKLEDMNDINELYRPLYFDDFNDKARAKRELSCLHQISLTQDGRLRGFDIPAMWGHYGEEGNGVCIILERDTLLNSLDSVTTYNAPINYIDDYSSDIHICKGEKHYSSFSEEEIMEYFFRKSYDWSYEQEYRILRRSESDKQLELKIAESFVGVIMHRDKSMENKDDSVFNYNNYKQLSSIVGQDRVLVYGSGLFRRSLVDHEGREFWDTIDKPYGELYMVKVT